MDLIRLARLFIIGLGIAGLAWECVAVLEGRLDSTISEAIRQVNRESGGLVALIAAALWVHWFIQVPSWWR